jgi:hypothetical protein
MLSGREELICINCTRKRNHVKTASQYRPPADNNTDGPRNVGSLALQPPDAVASQKKFEFKR